MTKTKTTHKFNCKLGQVGRSLGCCGLGVGVSDNGGAAGHLPSEVARGDAPIELDCQVIPVSIVRFAIVFLFCFSSIVRFDTFSIFCFAILAICIMLYFAHNIIGNLNIFIAKLWRNGQLSKIGTLHTFPLCNLVVHYLNLFELAQLWMYFLCCCVGKRGPK